MAYFKSLGVDADCCTKEGANTSVKTQRPTHGPAPPQKPSQKIPPKGLY